ncbi:MAG: sn-glycerol-3-phosphate ABC transporter ATP-binding protein UgpC [Succinatimonas sp.]|nr:sn-glycerol-3-phosphate ABC transporter ATP-binding protein UgpC [Succinatimonas sp.]
MSAISICNLEKKYSPLHAIISDLNLEIRDKEFLVLVGPSGCGKSTTLRMIAGLETITGGILKIGDRVVNDIPARERNIAMVFQSYALYPHMTVAQNMGFALKLAKVPQDKISKRVDEVAEILEIKELLGRKPGALSGGQRQRVALGRAMVRNPEVFLFDEPLSNLDAKLRTHMRTELIKLHQRLDTTFIYVTHDQIEAMTMADRIVVMNKGKIMQVDTPENLYLYPDNMFVASFIGSPQMNFIEAEILTQGDFLYLNAGRSIFKLPDNLKFNLRQEQLPSRELILGLRPESLCIDLPKKAESKNYAKIHARIDVRELLGADAYLHCTNDAGKLCIRVKADDSLRANDEHDFFFDINKIYLFDKKSGKSIIERRS